MASRRRRSVTWFPVIGTPGGEGVDDNASGRQFQIAAGTDTAVAITPVTFDQPSDPDEEDQDTSNLATYVGSEYMLRRIVGKLFATHIGGVSAASAALFGAGFFIARAADPAQGENSPIGSQSLSERVENYNPLSDDCIREPWIWRRTWLLGNLTRRFSVLEPVGGVSQFPLTTCDYGSIQDGPHIDAQTMRRVAQEERLWFVVAARGFPIGVTVDEAANVFGYLDFRLLGSLMKARNRGVF